MFWLLVIAINFSQKSPHFSLLSPTPPCELSEREVTSPSNLKVVGALIMSDLRVFSNWHPFQSRNSMADLLVNLGLGHTLVTFIWEVRNCNRFENWTPIWEFEKGHIFENWTLILRIWGTDVCDVEIGHEFEDGTSIRGGTLIWVLCMC